MYIRSICISVGCCIKNLLIRKCLSPVDSDIYAYICTSLLCVGEPGIPGVNGTGLPGPPGEPGPQGNTGDRGPMGLQGLKGQKGDVGDVGPRGTDGNPGRDGNPGAQGMTGTTIVFPKYSDTISSVFYNSTKSVFLYFQN